MSQTILIADDSKTVRTIVKMAFKASGYDVAEQGEGANVFSTVQNLRPDVLILDYFFPDADGYDLCREIKENPATADVPILMLGGKYKQFNEGLARTSGADAVLRKPFKTQALLDAVEEARTNAAKKAPAKPQAGPPSRPLGGPLPSAAPAPAAAAPVGGAARFGAPQAAPPSTGFGSGAAGAPPAAAPLRSPGGYAGVGGAQQQRPAGFGTGSHQATEEPLLQQHAAPAAAPAAAPLSSPPASSGAAAAVGGATADQIREIVREEIAAFVKDELPTLVQNVLGGPIQRKLLYKMIARADERYDEVVRGAVHNQVIIEIEKLLNETN